MELAEVGQDRSQNTKQASTHLLLARDDRGHLTSRATIANFSVLLSRLLAAGNHRATGALDVTSGARCLRLGLLRRPLIDRDADLEPLDFLMIALDFLILALDFLILALDFLFLMAAGFTPNND